MSIGIIIASLIAAATLLGAFWKKVVKPILSGVRRLSHFADDWFGEAARPGVPERLGVMSRLEQMQIDLDKIKHEMWPNSGGSLRDVVDRLEKAANSND